MKIFTKTITKNDRQYLFFIEPNEDDYHHTVNVITMNDEYGNLFHINMNFNTREDAEKLLDNDAVMIDLCVAVENARKDFNENGATSGELSA